MWRSFVLISGTVCVPNSCMVAPGLCSHQTLQGETFPSMHHVILRWLLESTTQWRSTGPCSRACKGGLHAASGLLLKTQGLGPMGILSFSPLLLRALLLLITARQVAGDSRRQPHCWWRVTGSCFKQEQAPWQPMRRRNGSMSIFILAEADGADRRRTQPGGWHQQLLLGRSRWGLQGRWAAQEWAPLHPSLPEVCEHYCSLIISPSLTDLIHFLARKGDKIHWGSEYIFQLTHVFTEGECRGEHSSLSDSKLLSAAGSAFLLFSPAGVAAHSVIFLGRSESSLGTVRDLGKIPIPCVSLGGKILCTDKYPGTVNNTGKIQQDGMFVSLVCPARI